MDLNNLESLRFFYPELILAGTFLIVLLADLFVQNKRSLALLAGVGTLGALAASLELYGAPAGWLFHRMIVLDNFSLFFNVVTAAAALFTIWMSLESKEIKQVYQGEYYALLLASALGMFFMASASNLLMAYLSLELASLTSYILTGLMPRSRRSGEAALKYLIYGGVASGTMIYGMSWIYGLTGSLDYATISEALFQGKVNQITLFIALVFILAGFGYKIVLVPFHMWSPDVYQGAPTPFTGFLSVASNAAGIAILVRFFFPTLSRLGEGAHWMSIPGVEWPHLLLYASMITMTLGNLCALNQQNLKRLLAYSGIAHAGYILMGLVVLNNDGLAAILFYIVVYLAMNLGAFLVVMIVGNVSGNEEIEAYRGLAWRGAGAAAVSMAIFMFSLTGLPPLAGFVGKFLLFAAVIDQGLYLLAIVAIINSVISLYYYARIVKTMFLDQPQPSDPTIAVSASSSVLLGILTLVTLVLGIYFQPLIQYANLSLQFFMPK